VGTWDCVIYGHPAFGDENVYVRLGADGSAQLARQTDQGVRPWEPLPGWWQRRGELTFRDPRTDRDFTADLSRTTLGGRWHTQTLLGGWWCTAVDPVVLPAPTGLARPKPLPRLRPATTATPQYPLQAIREAKEGRAVTCFLVDASGTILDPEIIELSDEVFRAPTLTALSRSRFQGWNDSRVLRPGCRSYTFELHARN
jgi:Gram-negative bacterial TonB protein C-terminal